MDRTGSGGDAVYDGFISYSHAADDLLAPRLQTGLQRFAKPWWQRRAMRVFRDESSLSANPHLWSSITEALDTSGWFVLLLSPDAAQSEWVNQEVAYWVEHKDPSRILPVVTAGDFGWADGDVTGDAVPDALRGVFAEEPRWVGMRWAREEDQLDLQNPRFADAVADIASAIRGVPKDDLASEEVKQHRRTVRTAWAAGALVLALAVAAAGFGVRSARNADEAERQASAAEANRAEAQANADAAEEQALLARTRELGSAAAAAVDRDPQLAKRLALAAIDVTGTVEGQPASVIDTLWQASLQDRLVAVFATGLSGGALRGALTGDGRQLAVSNENAAEVAVLSVPDGEVLWTRSDPSRSGTGVPVVEPGGTRLAVPMRGEGDTVVEILDITDGTVLDALEGPCPFEPSDWTPGGELLLFNGIGPCPRPGAEGGTWIEVLDGDTFEPQALVPTDDPFLSWAVADGAGRLVVFGLQTPAVVHEPPAYEPATVIPGAVGGGDVTSDGRLVVSAQPIGEFAAALHDPTTGGQVDVLSPVDASPSFPNGAAFSPDGSLVALATNGARTRVWDTTTGDVVVDLPSGPADSASIDADNRFLYTTHPDGTVKVWDLTPQAANASVADDLRSTPFVQGNSFAMAGGIGVLTAFEQTDACAPAPACPWLRVFDAATGELVGDAQRIQGLASHALPDGRALGPEGGGWTVVDMATGARSPAIAPPDAGWVEVAVSLDESEVMAVELAEGEDLAATIVDPADWSVVSDVDHLPSADAILAFTGDWILGRLGGTPGTVEAVDRTDGSILFSYEPPAGLRDPAEVSTSGAMAVIRLETNELVFLDTDTWQADVVDPGTGRVRGLAFGPDDTVLAISDDDAIHLFDLESGLVTRSIPFPGVSDLHWLDDGTLALGTNHGLWAVISLSVDDLVAATRASIRSGFTESECETYALDPCLTLEGMIGTPSVVSTSDGAATCLPARPTVAVDSNDACDPTILAPRLSTWVWWR